MATGLTFPLIRFNKDPVVISKNYFNGLNKFKRKIDAPKKFIDFKYCTKKMHARRYHRCNFFQNIKKSMPVYKTILFFNTNESICQRFATKMTLYRLILDGSKNAITLC